MALVQAAEDGGVSLGGVVERGWGHAGRLELTDFAPERDGFSVTRLEIADLGSAGKASVVVRRGHLPTSAVREALTFAQAALGFDCREHESYAHGIGFWSSSADFYLRVALDVGGGRGPSQIDRAFAGYESSHEQLRYLPIQMGANVLAEAGTNAGLVAAPIDAAARNLFSRQLTANAPRLDATFLLVGARALRRRSRRGRKRDRASHSSRRWENADGVDASLQRTRVLAAAAVAAIRARRDAGVPP